MPPIPSAAGSVSFSQQYRRCPRAGCPSCTPPGRGHGPYWYAYWWEGGRMRSRYLGKDAPAQPDHAAAAPALLAPAAAPAEGLRVRTLGGFAVWRDGTLLPPGSWGRRAVAALFKCLLDTPAGGLHREALIDLLFPEAEPATGAKRLRNTAYLLRQLLDGQDVQASHLQQAGESLALVPAPGRDADANWLDAAAFERAAAGALAGRDPAACRAAIALYAGDYLPDERYAGWADARRETLRRRHLALLMQLASLAAELADDDEAARSLRTVLVSEPYHEEAALSLIALLARQGRASEALDVYREVACALEAELGMRPGPALHALARRLRADLATDTRPRQSGNLPAALTTFVGRHWEREEVRQALRHGPGGSRLVTLLGAGGCGKTRLALEVARDLSGDYRDGVWLVELGALREPQLVPSALVAALVLRADPGAPALGALIAHLAPRQVLLVLDNCEHLVAACAELTAALLQAASGLRILATSQARLGVLGESEWLVPSLSLPEGDPFVAADLAPYEAIQLFVERAQASQPGFALTARNAAAVVLVCRRLDGIPLAIELATARLSALPVEDLASRLDDRFRLLTAGNRAAPARQRTLRAAIDWSHELLDEPERVLLRRLSVFVSGCTLEAAEAVCTGEGLEPGEIAGLLAGLVDKSMVRLDRDGEYARYALLETIRAYGAERLAAATIPDGPELPAVRGRFLAWCCGLASRAAIDYRDGVDQAGWLARLGREHDNLREALAGGDTAGVSGEVTARLRLASQLVWFWDLRGHLAEGRRWLERALATTTTASSPDDQRARAAAMNAAGGLAYRQQDYPCAQERFEIGLAIVRELREWQLATALLNNLANIAQHRGDLPRAAALLEESLALKRDLGDRRGVALSLNNLGLVARDQGRYPAAAALGAEALELFRTLTHSHGVMCALLNLGDLARLQGEYGHAFPYYRESAALAMELQSGEQLAGNLEGLAAVGLWQGLPELAVRLLGAAAGLREPLEPALRPAHERTIAALARALGEPVFARAFAAAGDTPAANLLSEALTWLDGSTARGFGADLASLPTSSGTPPGACPSRACSPDCLPPSTRPPIRPDLSLPSPPPRTPTPLPSIRALDTSSC